MDELVSGVLSGFVLLSGSSYALGTRLPNNRARAKSNFANTCPPDRERRRTGPRAQLWVLPRTSVWDPRTADSVEDHA
jgi:hypothetical protein